MYLVNILTAFLENHSLYILNKIYNYYHIKLKHASFFWQYSAFFLSLIPLLILSQIRTLLQAIFSPVQDSIAFSTFPRVLCFTTSHISFYSPRYTYLFFELDRIRLKLYVVFSDDTRKIYLII